MSVLCDATTAGRVHAATVVDTYAEDAELVRQTKEPGPDGQRAFTTIVRRNQQWVVRYLTHLLGSQADAEDVAQNVFARAFLALDTLQDPKTLRAWLRRIATNLAFNHRRSVKANRLDPTADPAKRASVPSTEGAVEARDAIVKTMQRLPYPSREILVLHYVEELKIGEIAELLDIGKSAAKMRLMRARDEFKRQHAKS